MAFTGRLHGTTRQLRIVRSVLGLLAGVAAGLAGSTLLAAEAPIAPKIEFEAILHPVKPPKLPELPKPTARPALAVSEPELPTAAAANNGFGTKSAFAAASVPFPDSSTLSPPVTLTYSGGSPVLLVNDSGTNKGVESLITNSKNSTSALFGQTNGSGAGLTGYNSGTGGAAGKFGITNTTSTQSAVLATTNGYGSVISATVQVDHGQAAIVGQNTSVDSAGTGVEGSGGEYGVEGFGGSAGIYGTGAMYGLFGYSEHGTAAGGVSADGFGVYGVSTSGYGTYASSQSGTGLYAFSETYRAIDAEADTGVAVYAFAMGAGAGVVAYSYSGYGISASSQTGNGIMGQSTNNHGVVGEDFGTGDGVYGYSSKGYAGYFAGKVGATSYETLSDRNAKTEIHDIDGKVILEKVSNLPVSSWVFKSDRDKKHVGPMAQDFQAAFGLDGADDKHINLTDLAGVSLAAIKELNSEIKQKDREIADLKLQLSAQNRVLAQMKSTTEAVAMRMTALERQLPRLDIVARAP